MSKSELSKERAKEILEKAEKMNLPPILENLTEEDLLSQIQKTHLKETFWDEVNIGDWAAIRIKMKWKWILLFAMISGDHNPLHVDKNFAATVAKRAFGGKNIAHGALSEAFLSAVSGYRLLGSGVYLHRKLEGRFLRPVKAGDEIIAIAEIEDKYTENIKGKDRYYLKVVRRVYLIEDGQLQLAVESPGIAGVLRKSRPS